MKALLSLALAVALATAGNASLAGEPEVAHQGHHPPTAPTDPKAPVTSVPAAETAAAPVTHADAGKVEAQLARMGDMHDRLAKARTPDERHALMAEHMAVMREGMAMMRDMSAGSMTGEGMNDGMRMGDDSSAAGMHDHMGPEMRAHHEAMQRRMRMMEAMMQMMMDRLDDPSPSK